MRKFTSVPNTMRVLTTFACAFLITVGETESFGQQCAFPFTIQGNRFYRDGKPVFLHIICYQPLEPRQSVDGEVHESRVQDDLRRLRGYVGGSDPMLLRVYAQPTTELTNRMPKSFYDGVRQLCFWIVRDIYFDTNYLATDAIEKGTNAIDKVIAEVATNGGFDRIFAWEIGNEFKATTSTEIAALGNFVCSMRNHIKARMAEPGRQSFSSWVTWGSWPPNDPLRTDGNPVVPTCLDYVSYNAYSYEPERIRDHQPGSVTGTPFQGYLAALKERYPDTPLVVSETGLADNPSAEGVHTNFHTWYPAYRKGGLTNVQVAEGLADRYWDARLLTNIAGISYFEWNDEWWKPNNTNIDIHNDRPEEWFGLIRFETNVSPPQARFKLQQEMVRDLYTLRFSTNMSGFSLTVTNSSLTATGSMTIVAVLPSNRPSPIRFRWEASRGYITGNSNVAQFYAGGRALGPAKVTAIAIDANHRVWIQSTNINIETSGPPRIELLTLGTGDVAVARASGRVENVDLDLFKLVVYIQSNSNYVQPFDDMTSIWIRSDGYWWTPVNNYYDKKLVAWLVSKTYYAHTMPLNEWPTNAIATNVLTTANDFDNDLLPDAWETNYLGGTVFGRYDDPDRDGADLLEEFLTVKSPMVSDNDNDGDLLWDNWERQFFGHLGFNPCDDPDGDGLANWMEFTLGLHPGRRGADCDRDGLPDLWEIRWFGCLTNTAQGDADGDGTNNLDAYELGIIKVSTASLPQIRLEGNNKVVLSWPTNIGYCFLDTKPDLSCCSTWAEFPEPPQVTNGQFVVTLTNLANSGFFRLWR
jgi:hypothetical protein